MYAYDIGEDSHFTFSVCVCVSYLFKRPVSSWETNLHQTLPVLVSDVASYMYKERGGYLLFVSMDGSLVSCWKHSSSRSSLTAWALLFLLYLWDTGLGGDWVGPVTLPVVQNALLISEGID